LHTLQKKLYKSFSTWTYIFLMNVQVNWHHVWQFCSLWVKHCVCMLHAGVMVIYPYITLLAYLYFTHKPDVFGICSCPKWNVSDISHIYLEKWVHSGNCIPVLIWQACDMWVDQYINTLLSCCHETKTHVFFFCYGLLLFSYNKKLSKFTQSVCEWSVKYWSRCLYASVWL